MALERRGGFATAAAESDAMSVMHGATHTLNPRLTADQLAAMVVRSQARVLVCSAELASLARDVAASASSVESGLLISSTRRIAALDRDDVATRGTTTIEGASCAFFDTDRDRYIQGGEGWKNDGALGAQVADTPEWGAALMDRQFDPVVLRLTGLPTRARPHAREEDIFWGYHFVTGALMLTLAHTGRIDTLSADRCHSEDVAAVKQRMASFMAAGALAPCRRRKGSAR